MVAVSNGFISGTVLLYGLIGLFHSLHGRKFGPIFFLVNVTIIAAMFYLIFYHSVVDLDAEKPMIVFLKTFQLCLAMIEIFLAATSVAVGMFPAAPTEAENEYLV